MISMIVAPCMSCPATGAAKVKRKKDKSYNTFEKIDRWIMDTGSGVDICSFADVPEDGHGLVKTKSDVVFHTANGMVPAGPMFPGIVEPLREGVAPYVLPSSPALLSMLKLVSTPRRTSCSLSSHWRG